MRIIRSILIASMLCSCWLAGGSDLRQIGMVNLPGAPGFGQLAFADGMLLLTHTAASSVDIFDPSRRRLIAQITGLQSPRAIVVHENAGRVYIADHGNNSIVVVKVDGWKVIDTIALSGSPDALLLDGSDGVYWTDAEAGTISLLDLHTKQDVARLNLNGTPRSLALDDARNLVYVTLQDQHQIVVLDPQLKVVNRYNLNASQPTSLVYDPENSELYVAVRSAVIGINANNGAEIDRVTAPAGVDALWLDGDSRTLYAASEGTLLVMSVKGKLALTDTINAEVKGHTVAYDADKRMVLLPGGREGKSKLQILRPMNINPQTGMADNTSAAVR